MNHKPDLDALIEASRIVTAPSAEDRERNRRKLTARIGSGVAIGSALVGLPRDAAAGISAVSGGGAGAALSAALVGSVGKWLFVSALIAAGGGVGVHAIRRHLGPATTRIAPAPPASVRIAECQLLPSAQAPITTPAADEKQPVPAAKPTAAPVPDNNFARALQLLRSAQRALDGNSPRAALALLDRYRIEFPRGSPLQMEYDATRVLALCAAGRNDEAERAKSTFLERQPGSPLADRVRTACGSR